MVEKKILTLPKVQKADSKVALWMTMDDDG